MRYKWFLLRIISLIPALIGVSMITFLISVSLPGDPVFALAGERADPRIIEYYRSKIGLDLPFWQRYTQYLKMAVQLDLGESYYTHRKVGKDLLEKIPNTLKLALLAIIFSSFFGILLGIISAVWRNSFWDKLILTGSTALISLPVFWVGMVLIYLFSYRWRLLPVAGMHHPLAWILPSVTLGSRSLGYLVRLTRSCMTECLKAEYILTVKAKGGGTWRVVYHALANAIIPIVTFIGLDFGSYLNGAVLTETIFGWDGIGRYAITGILRRDYPVILGTVLFGAFVFMVMNVIIDFIYMILNPKLRRTGV